MKVSLTLLTVFSAVISFNCFNETLHTTALILVYCNHLYNAACICHVPPSYTADEISPADGGERRSPQRSDRSSQTHQPGSSQTQDPARYDITSCSSGT